MLSVAVRGSRNSQEFPVLLAKFIFKNLLDASDSEILRAELSWSVLDSLARRVSLTSEFSLPKI